MFVEKGVVSVIAIDAMQKPSRLTMAIPTLMEGLLHLMPSIVFTTGEVNRRLTLVVVVPPANPYLCVNTIVSLPARVTFSIHY